LGAKVEAISPRFDSKFDARHVEFDALRSEVRANQQALIAALQNAVLRGEMGTQRQISEAAVFPFLWTGWGPQLRERVTRIEDQLRTLRQYLPSVVSLESF
jgi:hypothetical protein